MLNLSTPMTTELKKFRKYSHQNNGLDICGLYIGTMMENKQIPIKFVFSIWKLNKSVLNNVFIFWLIFTKII